MKKLKAFLGKQSVKDKYVARVKAHYKADEIIHGVYWENGKGCAVGCTMEVTANFHEEMEKRLGIPRELAYLEDALFEELDNGEAKKFPLKFLEAIPVGADLSNVTAHYVIWQFEDKKDGMSKVAEIKKDKELMEVCQAVVNLYKRKLKGDNPTDKEWLDLANRADEIYWARAWAGARAGAWARAWARAGAGAWARAWAWAGARAWAWAGARAWARAGARAGAWAGAGAGAGARAWARARAKYQKGLLKDEKKLLQLLKETK